MPALMTRFFKNRSGAAMIECTLIGALAIIAVVSGMALFAGKPASAFDYRAAQVQTYDQR
ncbi:MULTISPECIES: Flp family type IVb pilin [Ochrobactrum]|uniref:Flp family type IVb pilin n=1 Tax=Ochrobactrum chromiisoli TaxID=2993941 RepID=A0ABT3QIJ7_9HYPH|nr:Flp family type IVb pilin [Ochrobactrum chromiisoli]MCX2695419.1 Flp family type IVb pilin [Ochrobactrum chromiisoli]